VKALRSVFSTGPLLVRSTINRIFKAVPHESYLELTAL
jgi:hypothetical protein